MKSRRFHSWLIFCGVIAPPILVIVIITATIVTPDYSFVSETVSQLGAHGRPYPLIMNIGFITYGLLILGFAYSTYKMFIPSKSIRTFWLMFMIYGTGVILSGFLKDDVAGNSISTLEGFLHSLFAQVAFFALIIGIWFFARGVYYSSPWNKIARFSIAIAIFNLLSSMVFLFEFSQPVEGLLQRFFYTATLIWIEIISIKALHITRNSSTNS